MLTIQHMEDKNQLNNFLKGDVCTYIVDAPAKAYYGDSIFVMLAESAQTDVYVHSGLTYGIAANDQDARIKLSPNKPVSFSLPARAFISAFAQSGGIYGEFVIDVWYVSGGDKSRLVDNTRYKVDIDAVGNFTDAIDDENKDIKNSTKPSKGDGGLGFEFEP